MKSLIGLSHLLKRERFDIAHIHFASWGSTLRKSLAAHTLRRHHIPVVIHYHSSADYFRYFYMRIPKYLRGWVDGFLNESNALIVLSNQMYHSYREMCRSKISIFALPNPVSLPDRVPGRDFSGTLRLIFLGRLGSHKGPDRVLKAVSTLPEAQRNRIEVWLAGDGEVEQTRRLAQALGLEQQVQVSGWLDPSTRDQWLQMGHVMILPSRMEGIPMAILEGMAWGLPVITTPVGGIPEVVADGQEGFLVPSDDVGAISQAIQRFLEDPTLIQKMGHQARQRAENFSIERYRDKLKEIYLTVLESVGTDMQSSARL